MPSTFTAHRGLLDLSQAHACLSLARRLEALASGSDVMVRNLPEFRESLSCAVEIIAHICAHWRKRRERFEERNRLAEMLRGFPRFAALR